MGVYSLTAQNDSFIHEYTYDAVGNRVKRMEVMQINNDNITMVSVFHVYQNKKRTPIISDYVR
ncbi:MAG: hypothetical protein AAF806_21815 [Bacteroidota bacterium]